jgi:hypothetical protein
VFTRLHAFTHILLRLLFHIIQLFDRWDKSLSEPRFHNVIIDWHLYQFMFVGPVFEHVYSSRTWEALIDQYRDVHPIIVGEWSMGTGAKQAGQPYVDACVEAFKKANGWYLWNWKIQPGLGFDEWDVQLQMRKVKQTLDSNQRLRGFDTDQGLDPFRILRDVRNDAQKNAARR